MKYHHVHLKVVLFIISPVRPILFGWIRISYSFKYLRLLFLQLLVVTIPYRHITTILVVVVSSALQKQSMYFDFVNMLKKTALQKMKILCHKTLYEKRVVDQQYFPNFQNFVLLFVSEDYNVSNRQNEFLLVHGKRRTT